ncbi:MAG: DUF4422 domain-containing protein [Clostridia bacterium]|nr:DUF4422 domain-containing protein [Clostridia bacterium]
MNYEKKVIIVVATHKKYEMPDDSMYLPLFVGTEGKQKSNMDDFEIEYTKDNTGGNISELNPSFCELTGLYWAWKNIEAEYAGLVHYRRHFCLKKRKDPFESVLTYKQLEPYLDYVKIVVPNKRRYFIETLYSHYSHTHYASQLDETEKIIGELCPEYIDSYKKIVKHRSGYMFNMMIMQKELLDDYCEWLFAILFELRKRIDMGSLSPFQGRFYGRISEIIFNAWLDYQIKIGRLRKNEVLEIHCIHMEKINWIEKCGAFLKAKFAGVKYEHGF